MKAVFANLSSVRWPGKVPAGTVNDQVISLNDILATLASILDVPLIEGNAEDSFNACAVHGGDPRPAYT